MKLTYFPANITFKIQKDRTNSIVIERNTLFEEFVVELKKQIEKKGDNFLCVSEGKDIDLSREAVLIASPFDIAYEKKDLQKKVVSYVVSELRSSELSDELAGIFEKLMILLENLSLSLDFEFSFSLLDDVDFLKAVDVFLPPQEGRFAEKLISYADIIYKLTGKNIFVIANCDAYISDEDYAELCKYFRYAGLLLIWLRNRQRCLNGDENEYIIDNDLCELH